MYVKSVTELSAQSSTHWQMTNEVLFSENLKAPELRNQQAKTCLKEPKEMERVMFLLSVPALELNQSYCAHVTLDYQADPRSLTLSQTKAMYPPLALPVVGHAPRLMVLLLGPQIGSP